MGWRAAIGMALLVGFPAESPGQSSVRTILLLSGRDTIAVEQVTRSPGRLEGDLVYRAANQRWHYFAALGRGGEVTALLNEFRLAADAPGAPARQKARFIFSGDSVVVLIDGQQTPQRISTGPGALPCINPSFALVEQAIRRGLHLGKDSVDLAFFAVAGGQPFPGRMHRVGPDSVLLSLAGSPARLAIRPDGALIGGRIPSQGLRIVVYDGPAGRLLHAERPDYSAPGDAPYGAIPVRIPTPMGHRLAGTLTLPRDAPGPVPAVVTITGSGLQDRDEAIPAVKGYRPFREIADALGRRGIAVLRMDDRGYGESEGIPGSPTSRDYAEDIRAGLTYLRSRPEIDGSRLGLIGHSEGGLIAPLIAASDTSLKGIVLLAGPGYTGRRILEFQNRYALDHSPGMTPQARDSLLRVAIRSLDSLGSAQPWMGFFLDYDPLPTARRVTVPVLILQGATDQQVTADQAPLLEQAFRAGGNRDVTLRVYPAVNHLFLADPDGNPAWYANLKTSTLHPEMLQNLVDWVVRRLR